MLSYYIPRYSFSMLKINLLFIAFLTNSSLLMSPSPSSSTASLSIIASVNRASCCCFSLSLLIRGLFHEVSRF